MNCDNQCCENNGHCHDHHEMAGDWYGINVTALAHHPSPLVVEEAAELVPEDMRKPGTKITFWTYDGWQTWQFQPMDVREWVLPESWKLEDISIIPNNSVTTSMIKDGAITPQKVSSNFRNYMVGDLQNQIDSIQIGGWAISNQLGNDPHIGISQKALTDLIGYDGTSNTIRGRIKNTEDSIQNIEDSKGVASGIATLDTEGKVPSSQLPSYVDDVIDGYFYNNAFYADENHTQLLEAETGKIYVDLPSKVSYRYSGSAYVAISNPYFPDEEDLTVSNDIIKFKDKAYSAASYSGLGRKYLRKNMVGGVNTLTQSMVNGANTIYIVQYDYVLASDITLPSNCYLEFEGGSISGGTVTGVILNDVVKPEWFGAKNDGTTDCSEAVQNALNVCKDGGTVLFSEGSYAVKHCEVRRNCEIVGWGATLVGQKYQNGANSFDYIFISDGNDCVSFIGFRLTGIGRSTDTSINTTNNPLLYVNNAKVAKFESLFFDNVHSYNPSAWEHAYYHTGDSTVTLDAVALLGSIDVNKTIINNCEFTNCWRGEWTWISYNEKERADVELVYSNNYIHDYSNGNTPLNALVGNLIISNNTWENATYSGSLLNCHGYKTTIRDNVFKNCIASSVFDTCEYGQVYCDQVYIENNYVDCLNALVVLTTARVVTIKDNVFKALAAVQTYPYLGYETNPELRETAPTNQFISIVGNELNCNNYDVTVPQIAYTGQRCGIFAGECYCKGDNLVIRDNHIACVFDSDLVPSINLNQQRSVIRISNMDNVVIEGNYIQDLTPMTGSGTYMNIAFIEQQKSVKVSYDDSYLTMKNLSVLNNDVVEVASGKSRVIQIRTDFQYLDVKNATHDMAYTAFSTDYNVGIFRLKSPACYEFENAYMTDCKEGPICAFIKAGEIKNYTGGTGGIGVALLATANTVIVNFDSVSQQGLSVRSNRVISFGSRNWQNLQPIASLTHIPELETVESKPGDIVVVDGKAWRRCVDTRGAYINLSNITVS